MSTELTQADDATTADTASDAVDSDELTAELEVLREENRRLREEYRRATQATYRKTAAALAGIGLLALAVAAILPSVRDVLVIVGAIGVFGGVLTYYLTPERVLSATVAESLTDAQTAVTENLIDELGLQDRHVYVTREGTGRLFLPLHANYVIPDDLRDTFVVPEDETGRGVALTPSGESLYREFERASTVGDLEDPSFALADGVVEQLELADSVEPEVDREEGRASFAIGGLAIPGLDRPDHPVVSFLGIGLAASFDQAVTVASVEPTDTGGTVTFTWDPQA
ncbi:hypothetical protein [Haloarchaeobius sp. HME9146]|uniref:hypothetical protein n=1 Tax=Haloarchaeobius sp. HME9146 TaxID=2978732 RepID=UPI0021C120FE|nr:hypothetical protein [Haloarchaeobius sp. HME9146]MCT9098202.1 hypothetical protein [Haloarchaeobius sp. HME9146]